MVGNKYRIVHHIKDISMTPLPSDTLSPSDWGDKRRDVSESGQGLIDIQSVSWTRGPETDIMSTDH